MTRASMPGSSDPFSIYCLSLNDLKYTAQLLCFVFFPRPCLLSVMWRWTGRKGQQESGGTCSSQVGLLGPLSWWPILQSSRLELSRFSSTLHHRQNTHHIYVKTNVSQPKDAFTKCDTSGEGSIGTLQLRQVGTELSVTTRCNICH